MRSILHVLDHSLPAHSGYTFRTREIMAGQQALGWHVEGVTGRRQPADPAWQAGGGASPAPAGGAATDIVDGLTFHRTPPGAGGGLAMLPVLREGLEVDALAQAIAARLADPARPRIDLLHAHSPLLSGAAGLLARRAARLPLVYEIRAFWEDAAVGNGTGRAGDLRYRLTAAAELAVARRADHVVTICEGLRRDLIARGLSPDRISVVPNGVDLARFAEAPPRDLALAAELGLPAHAPVVGFIGSLYPYEGLDGLIAAMPRLVAAVPGVHALIVGGGPDGEVAALRAAAAASPVAHAIHFVGRVPHAEVERYYGLIDILLYPRRAMRLTETVTPLKPLEAMAQGRLVAASAVGGHAELIEDGVIGTLFAPDDPAALADAVAGLLADRAGWDARRAAARAAVARTRNWSSNIQRYAAIYDQAATAARARQGGRRARTGPR